MAAAKLQVTIRFRWWVAPYLRTLILFCLTMRTEPDVDAVAAFIVKYGLVVE